MLLPFQSKSVNISTIALEASVTGKENLHQKTDKTAINNSLMSLFIKIYDKFFMTSNFGSQNLRSLECKILVKSMIVIQ